MAPRKTAPAAAAAAESVPTTPPPAVPAPVEPAPVEAPAADAPAATPSGAAEYLTTVTEKLAGLASLHRDLGVALKEVQALIKPLSKQVAQLQKDGARRNRRSAGKAAAAEGAEGAAPRKPSGFAKPTNLSAELLEFLSLPANTLLARMEVTRQINKYVKDNNLYDATDKRTIVPDDKLKKLLNISDGQKVTYFNLQGLIKHHFIKVEAPAAPAPAPVAA
jgi:hypothetical protein